MNNDDQKIQDQKAQDSASLDIKQIIQNQTQQSQNSLDQNVQQPVQDQSQQQIPATPVGSLNKEAGPVAQTSEFLKPSESKPEIPLEVKEAGVKEAPSENPEITFEDRNAGVTMSVPEPHTEPLETINYPMSQTKAKQVIKEDKNSNDAKRWMAISTFRQFLRALFLKKGEN